MIDDAMDRLLQAIVRDGHPPATVPGRDIEAEIAKVAAAVAPLRLPDQLVAFWRRIDGGSLPRLQSPFCQSPARALDDWHDNVDAAVTARVMFPVCYESHWFLMVELEDGHGHGGAVFDWSFGAMAYELRHVDIAAWLDQEATVLELHEPGTPWENYHEDDVWEQMCAVRLSHHQPIAGYGHKTEVGDEAEDWPAHWMASNGADVETHTPRGATTTVADLAAAAAAGRAVGGTIQAWVRTVALVAEGQQVTVDDGTGSLVLWCPRGLSPYGPVHQRRFEFDVTVQSPRVAQEDTTDLQRDAMRTALSGDLAGASELLARLGSEMFSSPASAVVTALRPLE